jgi:hypothetical protein
MYMVWESFINVPARNTIMSFIVIYGVATYLPHIIVIAAANITPNSPKRINCTRTLLLLLSLFQAHYLYIALGPRLKLSHSCAKEVMHIAYTARSIIQVCLQLTLITILCIN